MQGASRRDSCSACRWRCPRTRGGDQEAFDKNASSGNLIPPCNPPPTLGSESIDLLSEGTANAVPRDGLPDYLAQGLPAQAADVISQRLYIILYYMFALFFVILYYINI